MLKNAPSINVLGGCINSKILISEWQSPTYGLRRAFVVIDLEQSSNKGFLDGLDFEATFFLTRGACDASEQAHDSF